MYVESYHDRLVRRTCLARRRWSSQTVSVARIILPFFLLCPGRASKASAFDCCSTVSYNGSICECISSVRLWGVTHIAFEKTRTHARQIHRWRRWHPLDSPNSRFAEFSWLEYAFTGDDKCWSMTAINQTSRGFAHRNFVRIGDQILNDSV